MDFLGDVPSFSYITPAIAKAETLPRWSSITNLGSALISGTQSFQAVWLTEGTLCTSVYFAAHTTPGAALTNQWASLYDQHRNKLVVTADDLTTGWSAFTGKNFTFTAPFRTTYTGIHYIGLMVAASTVPTMAGTGQLGGSISSLTPAQNFRDATNTGLTTPDTAPAVAALGNHGFCIYAQIR